jgi:hypothetical protein
MRMILIRRTDSILHYELLNELCRLSRPVPRLMTQGRVQVINQQRLEGRAACATLPFDASGLRNSTNEGENSDRMTNGGEGGWSQKSIDRGSKAK